jgi:ribosome-binding protein aMBF1 (putative translation factor)
MPKYSTGGGDGGDDGDACELCGRETTSLQRANVAGARLLVCSNCRPHDDARRGSGADSSGTGGGSRGGAGPDDTSDDSSSRSREVAKKQAQVYDAATGDSSHWEEEGTNYEDDRLPYLVSGYGERAATARQATDLTVGDLAEELGVDPDDLRAIEEGRAATADVGGSVVRAVADRLDVELVDE